MKLRRARATSLVADGGFSLVEVLVAMAIMAVVATASTALSLTGIATAATQERRQVAVTIASGSMESVAAQSIAQSTTTGVSELYTGRAATPVSDAWLANAAAAGVGQTYPAWDPTADSSSTATLPVSRAVTQAGTDYTVQTLLGTCYQPIAGGDCGRIAGYDTPPNSPPPGYTVLIRAIVVVTWTAGTACAAAACSYTTTTLIDPNTDVAWVTRDNGPNHNVQEERRAGRS